MRAEQRFPARWFPSPRTPRRHRTLGAVLAAALLVSGPAVATPAGVRAEVSGGEAQWTPLGSGIGSGTGHGVQAVAPYGNALVVSGTFTDAGGTLARNIALWDGTAWSSLGEGISGGSAVVIAEYEGQLIAGGLFDEAGGVPANRIARWDGSQWSPLGEGADAAVRALAVHGGDLIVAGEFSTIGGIAAQRIARWDGANWSALGSGLSDAVYAGVGESLAVYGGELVVGGLFDHAGGVPAHNVARWNGVDWAPLGGGVDGTTFHRHVTTLVIHNGALHAGGSFTLAGGLPAGRAARWDGTAWTSLGTGLDDTVNSLATYGGRLVAGGVFHAAGGAPAERIAAWDGAQWSPLGSGMDGIVRSVTVFGGQLMAGGLFTVAGGVPINFVAAWSDASAEIVFVDGFDPPPTLNDGVTYPTR